VTTALSHAGAIGGLTDEQRLAAGVRTSNVFIEAGPGTGKTTVSAHRFGVHRFGSDFRHDQRAVVAVSFTRAATYNLIRRVQRLWGASAVVWPHRVVTLDTIMCDLLHDLLRADLLRWPNGHTTLDVHDSWASFTGKVWNRTGYTLAIADKSIRIDRVFRRTSSSSFPATETIPLLAQGICTHDDVRDVLEQALKDAGRADYIRKRLAAAMRALIVDEVFDANDLDIAIIEAAIDAGLAVTLVGDPWQALYVFRGARPQAVPDLLGRAGVRTLPLTTSFRWSDPAQEELAHRLRDGEGVVLPIVHGEAGYGDIDVVLSVRWKELWDLGGGVLPLAFQAFKGGYEEAAATLLLNHVTRCVFGLDATYLTDAMTALAIKDRDTPRQLEPALQQVTETLRGGGSGVATTAYKQLVAVINTVSPRQLRAPHAAHTKRLAAIQSRLKGRPLPGLTTHQAKGGEWDAVGVRLTDAERGALAGGLSVDEDTHRKLYVACTRARRRTVELV
jgi:DNA helicase-2/ATP-dependent DNA helicase PcrA